MFQGSFKTDITIWNVLNLILGSKLCDVVNSAKLTLTLIGRQKSIK